MAKCRSEWLTVRPTVRVPSPIWGIPVYAKARLRLRGLEPEATYRVRDLDKGELGEMTGRELTDEGVPAEISDRPGSALMVYERKS